eukprot:TRINITY_DN4387_c1_g1_i1.p1 TRINITY_DN4387_c1_g1~~TRINITY_DN4387_c1_g1_i1.p1  ORF type:complete len:326 (+),score=84.29 TRINITY_DN4387_c1_g1_i1:31-978(+)
MDDLTDDIMNEDLYKLLEVEPSASTSEIKKAWRSKSRECHPDKHPDDPNAVKLFLKITKALDILADDNKRKVYDTKFQAKALRETKKRKLDQQSRNFRDDLERREREAKRQKREEEDREANLEAEISALREDGLRIIREQQQKERAKQEEKLKKKDQLQRTVVVKWATDDSSSSGSSTEQQSEENLKKIFSAFGSIEHLIISRKSALIVYENVQPAINSVKTLNNHPVYKFSVNLKNETTNSFPSPVTPASQQHPPSNDFSPPSSSSSSYYSSSPLGTPTRSPPSNTPQSAMKAHKDFEMMVLDKLKSRTTTPNK